MNHSPEPWRATILPDKVGCDKITDNSGHEVWSNDGWEPTSLEPDDLQRIVACVNFCAGIPTEDLEKQQYNDDRIPIHE